MTDDELKIPDPEIVNGYLVLQMPEPIRGTYVESLREWMQRTIEENEHHLALNLAQVDFIDSSGLSLLMYIQQWLKENGRQLVLLSPSKTVTEILQTTKLDTVFQICTEKADLK